MKRREFLYALGAAMAAVWPRAARAQRQPLPVLGVLSGESEHGFAEHIRNFDQGLRDGGFIDGQNVVVESRSAENRLDRLPALAADLVAHKVTAIATLGGPSSALAAKAASTTIPVVFGMPDDPVKLGLVASLARPGGNLTGVSFLNSELMGKRLDLMRWLIPHVRRVAVLVHTTDAARAEAQVVELETIGRAIGLQILIFKAAHAGDVETAFAAMAQQKPDAVFLTPAPLVVGNRVALAELAARHAIPAFYPSRDNVVAGGLMSYGTKIGDSIRQVGQYTARVLKGEKPADLPVLLPTRFELVLNLKTAKSLGLPVPDKLLALTDEVIE
jgi:putative tryptophan/tyrosine transport system substrate-binding protein